VPSTVPSAEPLHNQVIDGPAISQFLRDGALTAHVLSCTEPDVRLLVAFAAGSSGCALWFDNAVPTLKWDHEQAPKALPPDGPLLGVSVALRANVDSLVVRRGLMGSIRMLREYQHHGRVPPQCDAAPVLAAQTATWSRARLDGAAGYRLRLRLIDGGRIEALPDGRLRLQAARAGVGLQLILEARSADEPPRPLAEAELLNDKAAHEPAVRRSLSLLCFEDSWLAGSWRFLTYFGRDTLMSLRLLLPVLQPAAVDGALRSVLRRLSPDGRVAHEEEIGEFAALQRVQRGEAAHCAPIFDYKMVDDDFMLLPVLADALRDPSYAARFLAHPIGGTAAGALLMRNVRFVLARAAAFARDPQASNLVPLGDGEIVGDWRDSADGLAGGRYSYSVNVALMPAALSAIARLHHGTVLEPYLQADDPAALDSAQAWARVWQDKAPPCFAVQVPLATLHAQLAAYARATELPAAALARAIDTLGDEDVLRFAALSLDAQGHPIQVLHSDLGFVLLFAEPDAGWLSQELRAVMRPFPAGLMTEVGLLVANAAPAGAALWPAFGRDRYHGCVVWSWQQALLAAGLARQLRRTDLPPTTQAQLRSAQSALWQAIDATRDAADGELWSWAFDGKSERFALEPYGPLSATADESNAIQLWSTVYLAVRAPA
jgi:hypothetical protein